MLGLYGFAGWFIGMQNSRFPMYIAITQNIVNILASLCFVFLFGMKVEGVALGTLIAQYAGFLMALLLWLRYYKQLRKRVHWRGIWQKQAMYRFFQVNRDIFLRTLCLVAVTMFFTSAGAAQGEVVLAVNTLLMQLFTLFHILWMDLPMQARHLPVVISAPVIVWSFTVPSDSYSDGVSDYQPGSPFFTVLVDNHFWNY